MVKAEGYTNFTFRFDDALRHDAERLAKAEKWSLGVWVATAIEEKIARDTAATRPRKRPK